MIYSNIQAREIAREVLRGVVNYEVDEKNFFVFRNVKDLERAKSLLKKKGVKI